MASSPPISRLHLAVAAVALAASAVIELSWWWSRTKMRVHAAVPWTVRRKFYMRPR
ncbi:MAG TPA: hypothetical protein VG076_02175 [Acidimicrobiales bacterium]|nr:hypothetical protein [Acidimicrobiales bacterium]